MATLALDATPPHPAMKTYLMFTVLAAATVASPGPGVLMTLSNALQHGLVRALPGIAGIATGSLATAALSASGAGLMLAASPWAFAALRYAGALYLVYLGWRLWRTEAAPMAAGGPARAGAARLWWAGVCLQFSNPKSLLFFLSVLPQFVEPGAGEAGQLFLLVATYGLLVLLVHGCYACLAGQAQAWLAGSRGTTAARRLGGSCFVCFGVMLACLPR